MAKQRQLSQLDIYDLMAARWAKRARELKRQRKRYI